MSTDNKPTFGNGKICYIEIPATDINASTMFYETVFGWNIRRREDGSVSFDDGVGEVSGMWVIGRKPADVIGLMISIMVDDIKASIELIRCMEVRSLKLILTTQKRLPAFMIRQELFLGYINMDIRGHSRR
jgi:hypothetical protein